MSPIMLQSFAPVATPATKILVLGSMPGAQSLAEEEYYAHPRNGFWPIMGALFGASPALAYTQRLEILCANGIGLWDVIGSCQRASSLDSAIEEKTIRVNDLQDFIDHHQRIRRICFNGAKAEKSFHRYLPPLPENRKIELIRLPSTSPANARLSYNQKLDIWRRALLR